jgi:hypothetical protein
MASELNDPFAPARYMPRMNLTRGIPWLLWDRAAVTTSAPGSAARMPLDTVLSIAV